MKTKYLILLSIIYLLVGCSAPETKRITIFYTADEHGWLNDNEKADGAAALLHLWKEKENYTLEADSFLVLSGGDMWTGSSVSTWFHGKSMMEVMNALGYDAAALGNHEFDFSLDTLKLRSQQSNFPYLAANVTKKDGTIPCIVKPYSIIEANGLKVGLIGLANIKTPNTANPDAVKMLDFTSYAEAIKTYAPIVKEEGADLILIVGHICHKEMKALAPIAKQFNIPLITGGHCHKEVLEIHDDVLLIESHPYLTSYIKVVLEFDLVTKSTSIVSYEEVANKSVETDPEMATLVAKWEDKADEVLDIPIGYTTKGIKRGTEEMKKLTAYSWLQSIEGSDVVIVNAGGIRQDIDAGNISMGTILGLLPFNNGIAQMTLTGEQLQAFVDRQKMMEENYIIAGLDNISIKAKKTYQVLTTDFLYSLEETQFKISDPNPDYVPMLYREPTIQWIRSLNTSKENPIEKHL